MSSQVKEFLLVWGLYTAILFAICAFSQLTIEVDQWSTICRAIFGTGTIAIAGLVLYKLN